MAQLDEAREARERPTQGRGIDRRTVKPALLVLVETTAPQEFDDEGREQMAALGGRRLSSPASCRHRVHARPGQRGESRLEVEICPGETQNQRPERRPGIRRGSQSCRTR